MSWELTVLFTVIAMIIGIMIGYFIRKNDIDFYKEQIDVMWNRLNDEKKISRDLREENRELKGIKIEKYKWKDEK